MKSKFIQLILIVGLAAFISCESDTTQTASNDNTEGGIDRSVLPIRAPKRPKYSQLDVRDATPPPRFDVTAPEGAPNVVIILIDDMGFGASESFGGPIPLPTFERLANNGIRYNRFHTTALCAPTRMALLTGYNHHSNNMGTITETATTFPGYTGVRPQTITPLPEVLRQNGFNTAQFGKCHEVPPWEISNNGPQDRWPAHSGFEKFYGFLGGETNQWAPLIYDGVTMVETPDDPDYHFTTDMTNQAISWVRTQKALQPDKPFFMYYAPGATHAPTTPQRNGLRNTKANLIVVGIRFVKKHWHGRKNWALFRKTPSSPQNQRTSKTGMLCQLMSGNYFARQMEVYAGFAAHTDNEIGRLVNAIEDLGIMDNTIIIYIAGDNGASAEGQRLGMYQEMTYFNEYPETVPEMLKHYDEWGSPSTYPHFSAGWAVALGCTIYLDQASSFRFWWYT